MHSLTRSIPLLIPLICGCYCCPGYYGPGTGLGPRFSSGQYNSCVDTGHLVPPLAGGRERRRPTLAERRQQRELRRWYRDLDDSPNRRSQRGSSCPHCGRSHSGSSESDGFYDGVYGDEVVYDGQIFDGQIIDGAMMGGSCPSCMDQSGSYPTFSERPIYSQEAPSTGSPPEPTPSGTPTETDDSVNYQNKSSSGATQTANEYYFPPPPSFPKTTEPAPLQVPNQVQRTSVNQSLFLPPRAE